jgi:H+-transporting ATPase
VRWLSAVIIMLVVAIVVTASRGQSLVDIVTLLLVLLVSAIPVALPAMFTVSMAIGSKELVRHDVLVTRSDRDMTS